MYHIYMYFTYILECADGTLYTGSTNDLKRRVHEHNHAKSGAHYTKIRRPVRLVYHEEHETLVDARKRERQIQRLSRATKKNLVHTKPRR